MKTAKSSTGQALIELTLLVPLLVLILLGTVDFGRVFFQSMALAHAARAGAQYGAQSVDKSSDTAGMTKAAEDAAATDLGTINVTPPTPRRYFQCTGETSSDTDPSPCSDGKSPKIYVEVTVQKTFTTIFNYPGFPHIIDISRTALIRVQ